MKHWIEYLRSIADRDVWGLVVLDYYHRSQQAEQPEPPSRFLDRVVPEIWRDGLDVVRFNGVFLSVAVQLLGTDFDDIIDKNLRLLKQSGNGMSSEQVEEIGRQFETYGKRELFLARAQRALGVTEFHPSASMQTPSGILDQPARSTAAVQTAELRTVRKEHLEQQVRAALAAFAQPKEFTPDRQQYMAYFADSGRRKGQEFLHQLSKHKFPVERVAVVSIGGADGSEIDYVLRNGGARVGVLLEMDHAAADIAREKDAALRRDLGKHIEVFEGDATQSIQQALTFLKELAAANRISGVAYSINAVLHELPSRGSKFNLRQFIHSLNQGWLICAIAVREPCWPKGWPQNVEIKSDYLAGPLFSSLAKVVQKWCGLKGNVVESPDNFVLMPSRLAIEVLFKLFYIDDFEYELQERVTTFHAVELRRALETAFEPSAVDSIELNSDSFNHYYGEYGIRCRDNRGRSIGKPLAFTGIIGIRLPK